MGRFRHALSFATLVALTELSLLTVTHWPVRETTVEAETQDLGRPVAPLRVGYGYRPLSGALMDWLRSADFQLVVVNVADRDIIQSGRVDAKVMDDDGGVTNYVTVEYDAQSARSRAVGKLLQQRIDAFPGRPTHALLSPVSNEPFSFHLFFGVVLPLLVLASVALGVFLSRRERIRGRVGIGLLYAAGFLIMLTLLLPGRNFPGNESISASLEYPPLPLLPVGLFISAPLAVGLASLRALRDRAQTHWVLVLPALTVLGFVLVASGSFDGSPSAWVISQVPGTLTLSALFVAGFGSAILARALGAAL